MDGAGEAFKRTSTSTRRRLGQIGEPPGDVPPATLVVFVILDVLQGAVAREVVRVLHCQSPIPAQRRPVVGFEGAVGAGARDAGGVRLVELFHVELGQNILPSGLPGELLHVILVGVDQMKELGEISKRGTEEGFLLRR